jgi:hypothetical protein
MSELKPCPFCGGSATHSSGERKLYCTKCLIRIEYYWYDNDIGTVEACWNTRVENPVVNHDPRVKELVEALESAIWQLDGYSWTKAHVKSWKELIAKWREGMSNWQPIETAPEDGTDVLVYIRDSQWPVRVAYYRNAMLEWRCDISSNVIVPDFWQPLPDPPEE